MTTRVLRTLAVGAGVGALVLGMAAPALAVTNVTSLPSNVKIAANDTVQVTVAGAAVCAPGTTGFRAFIPGRQDAVAITNAQCTDGTLTALITPPASAKKNAVVKFTSLSGDAKVVQTLVVRVDKAKPAKPAKPGGVG